MDAPIIFKMKVTMNDFLDTYSEEDIVKNIWPHMSAFLTRRKGVNRGKMELEDGAVTVEWTYCYRDSDEWWDENCESCGQKVPHA